MSHQYNYYIAIRLLCIAIAIRLRLRTGSIVETRVETSSETSLADDSLICMTLVQSGKLRDSRLIASYLLKILNLIGHPHYSVSAAIS